MGFIKLEILAKDIRETNYFCSSNCAITKALQRAGFSTYRDSGYGIEENHTVIVPHDNPTYRFMFETVIGMYATSEDEKGNTEHSDFGTHPREEIRDRNFILDF